MFNFFRYPHTDLNQQNLDWLIGEMKSLVGEYKNFRNPEVVHFADEMTNENKIYIYEGSESGYLADYWYYFNDDSRTWIAGGPYGMGALPSIDPTLTLAGHPADAKAVGDAIATVNTYRLVAIDVPSFSQLPITVNNANITEDSVLVQCILNNPKALKEHSIGWTTSNGTLTLSGTLTEATTATVYLTKKV